MPTETIVKTKSTKTCRECGSNLAGSATSCQNCNSTNLAKSIVVIRKSESTGEDALAPDPQDEASEISEEKSEEEEDDEYEDLDEEDFEAAEDDGEEDEDEDEEEDDSEDDEAEEDEEEEDEEDPKVTKRIVRRPVRKSADSGDVNLDILLAALTVADDISKAVESNDVGEGSSYDRAMHAFNNVCDAGVTSWVSGDSISKEDKAAKLKRLKARVAQIKQMLAGNGEDDEDGDEMSKRDDEDIFKGLSPKAAAILKQAQEIQERDKVREFQDIAKSFGSLPTSEEDLGAALRLISETDKTAYDTVTKALKAAAESQKQSDIFKSFGSAQTGLAASGGDELDTIAKSIMSENKGLTEEQAYAQALHQNPQLYDAFLKR